MARKNVNEVSRDTSASCSTSDLRYRLLMAALGPDRDAGLPILAIDPAPAAVTPGCAPRTAKRGAE